MMTMSATHYDTLEVSRTASAEAIKANYRRLMRKHHPDHGGNNPELAGRINEAYETLSNARTRATYDAELAAEENTHTASASPNTQHSTPTASAPGAYQHPNTGAGTFYPGAGTARPNPYPDVLPHHARPEDYFLDDNLRRSVRIERTAGSVLRYVAHGVVLGFLLLMIFIVTTAGNYFLPSTTAAIVLPLMNIISIALIGGYVALIIRGHLNREKKRAAHNAMFGAR